MLDISLDDDVYFKQCSSTINNISPGDLSAGNWMHLKKSAFAIRSFKLDDCRIASSSSLTSSLKSFNKCGSNSVHSFLVE